MKRKWLSALVLSTLMTQVPISLAMEKDEALKPSHNVRTIAPNEAPPELHLDGLPRDILCLILDWCHPSDFLALKKTCKKFYQIASDPTFYLAENPDELLKQLPKFIDQKNQTFRFNALLRLMVRTKDVGNRLYMAGKDYVFDPQHPQEAHLKGLALWLAKCAGHKDARDRRNDLKKSFERRPDQAFFHLLPSRGGLDVKLFDSYKLRADFFELGKKIAQSREKEYMDYGALIGGPSRFRDILRHVSGASIYDLIPKLDDKTKEMVAFFREKEMAFCADEIHYLNKIFEKRKGTEKELILETALKNAADYAEPIFQRAIDLASAAEEKKILCLKLAALQEEAGQWTDAAENYRRVAHFSDDRVQKRTCFLKSASLFEKADDMQGLADLYYCFLAPCSDEKRESVAYFLYAACLYEGLGQKRDAARAYEAAYLKTPNKTQKENLLLKVIPLYAGVGDKEALSSAYLTLARLTSDNVEKEKAAQLAFSCAEKVGPHSNTAFLSSLFLSCYAKDTERWIQQRDALWQEIDKDPAAKKYLSRSVDSLKNCGNDDLSDKLEKFIDQRWPEESRRGY